MSEEQAPQPKRVEKERTTKRLPKGNYALVSVDVDATGRRLIDEVIIFFFKFKYFLYLKKYCNLQNKCALIIYFLILCIDCAAGCIHPQRSVRSVHNAVNESESSC